MVCAEIRLALAPTHLWLRATGIALCALASFAVHAAPGDLDPSFGTSGKTRFGFGRGSDVAQAVAIQPDGKIVLLGASAPLISEHNVGAAVRLNQDGTLDLSFGRHGKAPVPLDTVSATAIDAAGRIVVAGSAKSLTSFDPDFAAVRLNSDGSLDTSFGNGGKSVVAVGPGFYDAASSLALQIDGKIVLAGQGTVGTVGGFVVARLNSDGTVDPGFGDAGRVAVAVPGGFGASGVVIDASGRIVMSGSALVGSYWQFAFVRLASNGTPDTGFGTGGNGIVTIPVSGGSGQANALAIDPSGRIVAAGNAITASWDFATIRLNDNGALDSSFGSGGISVVPGWGISTFNAIAIQVDGKIVMTGNQNLNSTTPSMPMVVRLNADGTPDSGFGSGFASGGKSAIAHGASGYNAAEVTAVAFDAFGRPVVAGYDGWNRDFAAWRLNYDGAPDASFGTGGEVLVDVGDEQSQARALTRLPDGKFLVAGFTSAAPGRFAVAKLNPNGSFDPTFGTYGETAFSLGSALDYANGMTVTANGQILLVGQSKIGGENVFSVARVNSDGTVDTGFGEGGKTFIAIGSDDRAYAVATDSAGGIIVAGSTYGSGIAGFSGTAIAVVRLGADGALDISFGAGGKVVIPIQGDYFGANSMTIDMFGKIIVVGKSNSDFGVARLNSNGTFDTGFGSNGQLAITVGGGSAYARTVQVDANGDLLIAGVTGSSSAPLAVVRLKADGTRDTSFGSNGIASLSFGGTGYYNDIQALAIDSRGRIVVAGAANVGACCDRNFAVARLLSNGMLDTAFGTNGIFTAPVGENDDVAYAMALQPDGKIVLAGNGSYSFGMARIEGDPLSALDLEGSWSLIGNSVDTPLDVATAFGDAAKVTTVWKWIPVVSKWAFYTPTQADGGAAYAASRGYDFLTTINGGEGFWVNAKTAFTAQLPTGTAVPANAFANNPTASKNLPSGWSLVAVGDNPSPRDFANALGVNPPSGAVAATSVSTLWVWHAAKTGWYFYAPSLDNAGTLANYIATKSYLDFTAEDKKLGPSVGFWVNRP